ncbi:MULTISPECIES: TRAP transporter small permease [unclassified Halomonas]|uniref:TRAP transporter small permease n=1 Tax=unclassified Halomonas TaxID=2609666 RepID=UPI0021E3E32A|nr:MULTISPECIES: TRAP transporter small permease [unclassified Halomonas]UYF98668.1 TRAP transporter small permease [Halomonas sp. GD1P12]WNL40219.1 TRAP transporter small permease [Halomonas sp. PAMB 3232]WNL43550.1 TRAP transporter small permease [Halomonas sp. PAMB 3264]
MINTINRLLSKLITVLTSAMLAVMVLVAIWQVVSRYVLNDPSTFSQEFLRYSLIWITMIGGALAFHTKKHIAVEMLVNRFSARSQKMVRYLVLVLLILFSALVMIYGGIWLVSLTMSQQTVSLGIPMGYIYLSLPVSGVLVFWFCIAELFNAAAGTPNDFDQTLDV